MNKTLIFDFDGTIADTVPVCIGIISDIARKEGYGNLIDRYLLANKNLDIRKLIKEMKLPLYKLPFLMIKFKEEFKKQLPGLKLISGTGEVLNKLHKKNYQLDILTSNSKNNVELFLKNNSLDIFRFIYSDIGLFGKASGLKKILNINKLNKDQTFYIGDEARDIQAAKKIGVKMISVTWGMQSKEMLKILKPDFLIDHPEQLLFLNL